MIGLLYGANPLAEMSEHTSEIACPQQAKFALLFVGGDLSLLKTYSQHKRRSACCLPVSCRF